MSRYTGGRVRIVRRLGGIELPGLLVPRELRRPYPPGQHGPTQRIKLSDYAIRLREKQKLRYHYGIGERQFVGYMVRAKHSKGNTGESLLSMLESRLDNVIYRLGYVRTIRAARQMVSHGHVAVNGKKVDVPSYLVSPGQVIEIRETSKHRDRIKAEIQGAGQNPLPSYLDRDDNALKATFKSKPEYGDCPLQINEALVVELYAIKL